MSNQSTGFFLVVDGMGMLLSAVQAPAHISPLRIAADHRPRGLCMAVTRAQFELANDCQSQPKIDEYGNIQESGNA